LTARTGYCALAATTLDVPPTVRRLKPVTRGAPRMIRGTQSRNALVLRTAIAPPVWRGCFFGYGSLYAVPKPGQDFRRCVLASLKLRAAFFRKSNDSFLVVLAVETIRNHLLEQSHVTLG
jgi:hypothetical protein